MPAGVDPRQVFLVHVMKTGGTTVFRYLRENFELDRLYPYRKEDIRLDGADVDLEHHLSVPYLLGLPAERHQRIRVYTGHFPFVVTDLLGRDLLTVTLLRDPVERTISLLRQVTRATPWLAADDRPPLSMPIEEAYEHPAVFEPLVHDHQTKMFSMTAADAPRSFRDVVPMDQPRLERAKQNIERVDVLGVTERYPDFIERLEARTGWYTKRGLRKNASPGEEPPVSASLRRRIAEDNALDVELHAFASELVHTRR